MQLLDDKFTIDKGLNEITSKVRKSKCRGMFPFIQDTGYGKLTIWIIRVISLHPPYEYMSMLKGFDFPLILGLEYRLEKETKFAPHFWQIII